MLIVQLLTPITKTSDSYLKVITLSKQSKQAMNISGRYLSIISFSAVILVQLLRQFLSLKWQIISIVQLSMSLVFFLALKEHPTSLMPAEDNNLISVLMFVSLLYSNPNFRYFLPCLVFLALVSEPQWMLPT